MKNNYLEYKVFRRNFGTPWLETGFTIRARTPKEAQAKLKRMFKHAGFSSMQLLASFFNPNTL